MTKCKLYGPFFFVKNSIMSNIYLNISELFLELQLQDDGILDTVVFQYNGAPPHFVHIVHDYLSQGDR
jgi:hypothetical protein